MKQRTALRQAQGRLVEPKDAAKQRHGDTEREAYCQMIDLQ